MIEVKDLVKTGCKVVSTATCFPYRFTRSLTSITFFSSFWQTVFPFRRFPALRFQSTSPCQLRVNKKGILQTDCVIYLRIFLFCVFSEIIM